MDERRKEALKKHQQRLRTGIAVGHILPALRPVLTEVEYDQVQAKESNTAMVDELINTLLTKANKDFDEFCKVLHRNKYRHWVTTFQKEIGETIGR